MVITNHTEKKTETMTMAMKNVTAHAEETTSPVIV